MDEAIEALERGGEGEEIGYVAIAKSLGLMSQLSEEDTKANAIRVWRLHKSKIISAHNKRRSLLSTLRT
jgi:hypothetical protein